MRASAPGTGDPLAHTPSRSPEEPSTRPPSFGPPSIPYVPPPSLEEIARLARQHVRVQGRKGGRLLLAGGILSLLTVPVSLLWVRAVVEGILGGTVPLENFLAEVEEAGYMPILGALMAVEAVVGLGAIVGVYLILSERAVAAYAMVPLGAVVSAISLAYMGLLYGLLGGVAGLLIVVGGIVAIPRPLPGERITEFAAPGRAR